MDDEIRDPPAEHRRHEDRLPLGQPGRPRRPRHRRAPASQSIIVLAPEVDDPDTDVIKTILAITNDPNRRPGAVPRRRGDARRHEPGGRPDGRRRRGPARPRRRRRSPGSSPRPAARPACRSSTASCSTSTATRSTSRTSRGWSDRTFGEALLAFEDSTPDRAAPAGGRLRSTLRGTVIAAGDQVIVISRDDDTIGSATDVATVDEAASSTAARTPVAPEARSSWAGTGARRDHPRARRLRR